MPKSIFQDMVKINSSKKPEIKRVVRKPVLEKPEARPKVAVTSYEDEPISSKNRHGLWIVAGVAIVFFLFSLSYFFARAEIIIDPKIKDLSINLNLSAELDGNTEAMTFDLVAISGDVSKTVTATEKKEVAESARGTVVIYNNFSTNSQKLDIDTRLEGSNGKIYKTEKAIVVPGMTGSTPGSVEVGVYSVETGVGGNSKPLDFKILGFKGTPKYEKFYGRSKGDLVGGFKGLSYVVSETDKSKALSELHTTLQKNLLQKATDQIPSGFVLLKDAVYLETEESSGSSLLSSSSDKLPVTLKGTLHGVLFEEQKLSTKIVQKVVDGSDGADTYIANIKDLTFKLSSANSVIKDAKTIDFNLSGSAKVVWRLDSVKLISDLLGKSKSDFNQLLLGYPNVVSANLSLSPIWSRTIPGKAKDIKIIVNYPVDPNEGEVD